MHAISQCEKKKVKKLQAVIIKVKKKKKNLLFYEKVQNVSTFHFPHNELYKLFIIYKLF